MRVIKEMHPLCCITLESSSPSAIEERWSEPALLRTGSAFVNGSDANAGGSDATVSVAGLLYKWTNYHKGWRSRWFTLRNGVLSYSKTRNRPDNLPGDDIRLIGENKIPSSSSSSSSSSRRKQCSKSVGIVHLKVYSTSRLLSRPSLVKLNVY